MYFHHRQWVYQLYRYFLLRGLIPLPKKLHKIFSVGLILFFRLVGVQCRRKTMWSRSDVNKVSDLCSGTKGNLKICLLNTKPHVDMEQLMSSFYFLIVLGIQYRKVQEMQIFGMFWRQFFSGAVEVKGGTQMHLLLTNKKQWWWMGRLIETLLYVWYNRI